jgi:GDP-L-fucose synthase
MKKDSKIYVAGHNGLVGSAIVKNLNLKGYSNIIGKTSSELDLRSQFAVKSFFDREKPKYVFLAAAKVGGIVANNTYPAEFIYENIQIQNNVIHQSYKNAVKKLLFLGSTCIYPKDSPQPMKEEYLLTGPLEYTNEPYAIAKIAGIKMCESYNMQYNTNFVSVMPTNLYGPNDNFDLEKSHVLPALIRKMHLGKCLENNDWTTLRDDLNKRPIEGITGHNPSEEIIKILSKYGINKNQETSVTVEIWGSGKPLREFLWSEEMADACVFIMENINFSDLINKSQFNNKNNIRNTHINIGTGKEITIRDLAHLIKEIVEFNGILRFNTEKPDGTIRKLTDSSKLHMLGWSHKTEIDIGTKILYNWFTN